MKIVDVAEYYSEEGGGIRTYIQAKMRAGAKRGHEVVVVAPGRENLEEEKYGGRIIWLKGPAMPFDDRYGVMWNMKAVHRVLDAEAPDVVEGSSVWMGGQFAGRWRGDAVKTLVFHQDPVAVGAHTFFDRYLSRGRIDGLLTPVWAYLRSVSKKYDATVVAGTWLGDRLRSFSIHNPVAVPFGIDKEVFSPARRDAATRRALLARCGLDENAGLLLTVSRFHPEKRLGTLFETVRRLQELRPVGLVVYGAGFLSKKLRRLADETPQIVLAGYTKDREELATIYASADALLHGSAAETFGLGVAEAVCSGLPCVVPNVGGAADLVSEASGALYEPGDVTACMDATIDLLDRPRASLVAACADRAKQINTVDQHFEQLFGTYAGLCAARG